MPTATSFAALGRGNGFPFCLDKVNVSPRDYWVTLGGTKKGDPTSGPTFESQKNVSLQNAMNLFWNLSAIQVDIRAEFESSGGFIEATFDNLGFFDTGGSYSAEGAGQSEYDAYIASAGSVLLEPADRVCKLPTPYSIFSFGDILGEISVGFNAGSLIPIRMYNGPITDEDNFVGYGAFIEHFYNDQLEIVVVDAVGNSLALLLSCAGDLVYDSSFTTYASGYVDINGIHFHCELGALGSPTEEVDLATLKATVAGSSASVDPIIQITGFDFYDYP